MSDKVQIVVYVSLSHCNAVREALAGAGAGRIGNYDFCFFSTRGVGRFRGNDHSNPVIGEKNQIETVEEERIEVTLDATDLKAAITAMKSAHPYEEVAFNVYPLLTV